MKTLMMILLPVASVVLMGCAGSDSSAYDWPEVLHANTAAQPAPATAAVDSTRPSNGPTTRETFGELSLEEALARTRSHPDLAQARARVEAAAGRLQQAGTLPNPN